MMQVDCKHTHIVLNHRLRSPRHPSGGDGPPHAQRADRNPSRGVAQARSGCTRNGRSPVSPNVKSPVQGRVFRFPGVKPPNSPP